LWQNTQIAGKHRETQFVINGLLITNTPNWVGGGEGGDRTTYGNIEYVEDVISFYINSIFTEWEIKGNRARI